ncbi:MAG: MaoC family dehydratase [Candidatus Velthaea sp.]
MTARFLEDYVPGEVVEVGALTVDPAEVHAFAERFDPQPIHIDPAAAARSPYGGIIASGWHTAAMTMRLMLDNLVAGENSLGSPGIGALRWVQPVRPGDVLRVRVSVTANRRSRTKPDRGLVTLDVDVYNQRNELVMSAHDWIAIVRARQE